VDADDRDAGYAGSLAPSFGFADKQRRDDHEEGDKPMQYNLDRLITLDGLGFHNLG
jgi:hypothetical protein